jgi:hypothetical protein
MSTPAAGGRSARGTHTGATTATTRPKALAFYLPQFHPIPENDRWWGPGFTEWRNVARARPLFPGHYQPHVPGELGYYDLRLPEVRAAQAELARSHGIAGFVYYHYWFHGTRLLERPFEEVLASGEPDFPFALCWANEPWSRRWDQDGEVLMEQRFSEEADLAHIRSLLGAFADPRYIRIDGRPLFLVYRPALLPEPRRTFDRWRAEAVRAGFPDLYLCWVESWGRAPGSPQAVGLDASVGFMPLYGDVVHAPLESLRGHRVFDYPSAVRAELERPAPPYKRFPSVMVGWDNTARRGATARMYLGATPAAYEEWLRITADSVAEVRPEENYLFVLAWNEWAEGNHLEPDQRYGRAFLEATRAVLLDSPPPSRAVPTSEAAGRVFAAGDPLAVPGAPVNRRPGTEGAAAAGSPYVYAYNPDSAVGNAARLVCELALPGQVVVDLGAGGGAVAEPLLARGLAYRGIERDPDGVAALKAKGLVATECDLTDTEALTAALDEAGEVGALLALDVLEHLEEPQALLATLSAGARAHGSPPLVVSVPHVAHVDVGLRLLLGHFDPRRTGLLDATHLRFFTEETLSRLVGRTGWELAGRDDFCALRSDQFAPKLRDGLPEELVGAIQVVAEATNPNWSVTQFVWVLRPCAVEAPPATYYDAVAPEGGEHDPSVPEAATKAVADYLASVGLVVSEANRRAAEAVRAGAHVASPGPQLGRMKQHVLAAVYRTPRRAALFQRAYARLRGGQMLGAPPDRPSPTTR